jgi:hypothetical protein
MSRQSSAIPGFVVRWRYRSAFVKSFPSLINHVSTPNVGLPRMTYRQALNGEDFL